MKIKMQMKRKNVYRNVKKHLLNALDIIKKSLVGKLLNLKVI